LQKISVLLVLLLSLTGWIVAKGTIANTPIANQADVAYAVGGIDHNLSSNTDTFIVDQVVDVQVNWQDTAPVKVAEGDHGRVLTFRVTNEGNGDDNLALGYEHNTSSDFTPTDIGIFRDTNGNGHYDPGVDLNVSRVTLGADENVTLFIVGTIPDDNTTAPGKHAYERLHATSESNATVGADRPHALDVVLRKPHDVDQGVWVVRDYWLATEKKATVHSHDSTPHTDTRVTYTITVWIGGNTTGHSITQIHIHDVIPTGTQYLPGTLHLDGTVLTDPVDGDAGQCDGTAVDVTVGTITGTVHKTATFDVEII